MSGPGKLASGRAIQVLGDAPQKRREFCHALLLSAKALIERAEADLQIADLGGQGRDPFDTDLVFAHPVPPGCGNSSLSATVFSRNSRPALRADR